MRRKFTLSVLIIIGFYFFILSFYSCNKDENPVKPIEPPPPGPDTVSRYIWSVHKDYVQFYNVYAADTNQLYIVVGSSLLIYNGTNYVPVIYDSDILVKNVYGYDKNNIIATGFRYKNGNYYPAVFKLTNGNMLTYIYENECNISLDLLVTGPNQAWLSSFCESKVYYYDNGNLTAYRLSNNDSIKCGIFYKDPNNNLFVFAHKFPPALNDTIFTYKFSGNSFDILRTDFKDPYNPDGKNNEISRCGTDVIMLPDRSTGILHKLYYFNGNEWVVHSFSTDSIKPQKIGGISRDSLVALCMPFNDMYTYRNGKWRRENRNIHIDSGVDVFTNVEVKFGNVYLTDGDIFAPCCYIIIGKQNKNNYHK